MQKDDSKLQTSEQKTSTEDVALWELLDAAPA
jgi:hypothetical protein